MIEPRVYRAAFLPAILAVVVAMFSLESRPPPAPLDLAADVLLQGDSVAETAQRIARREPDRRPGTPGDAAVADLVARGLEARGFQLEVDEFSEQGRALRNVIGTRTGSGRERIVVLAARDAPSVPDLAGSATDTAALLAVATALEGRATEKTVVLASVDGSVLGDAGVERFAETATDREHIEAVLVLSDLGAGTPDGPRIVSWSNDSSRGSIALERTAAEALRREFEAVPVDNGVADQLAHLALPIGVGAQGVLLEHGIEAVRFSGSGVLPPDAEPDRIDADRVGGLGRAALQTISAIDASAGLEQGPPSYVVVARSVLPQWAVSVLALALLLPALVASVDAFARARRRREPVGSWTSWVVTRIVPFAVGLLVALLLVVGGVVPNVSATAPPPALEPLDVSAAAALGMVAAAVAVAWIFLRPTLARWSGAPDDPAAPGAGCSVALVISATALVVWAANPFAGLALVPAAHLWSLPLLGETRVRARSRGLLVAGGLVLPAAVAVVHMARLSLDPLEGAWYLLLLVGGGQIDLFGALVGCVLLGTLASAAEILLARGRRPEPLAERGPALASPRRGSLRGSRSAVER